MGRARLKVERIKNKSKRQVTFSNRRARLFKEARELYILCDAEIAMIIISSTGRVFEYASSSMLQTLSKYNEWLGSTTPENEHEASEEEVQDTECQKVNIEDLKTDYMNIMGKALSGLDFDGLRELELLMNEGLLSVKRKKEQLLKEKLDLSLQKEKEVKLENANLRREFEELQSLFPENALPVLTCLSSDNPNKYHSVEHVALSQASASKPETEDEDSMTTLFPGPPDNGRRKRKTRRREITKTEYPCETTASQTNK